MSMPPERPRAEPAGGAKHPVPAGVAAEVFGPTAARLMAIALVLAATAIPPLLVSGVIEEREQRQAGLRDDFKRSWGPEQGVHSPILVVPYRNNPSGQLFFLKIAPDSLKMTARLAPEERRRGLFHATVYGAQIAAQGTFRIPSAARIKEMLPYGVLDWQESFVMVQASSLSGMTTGNRFSWDGQPMPWQNCRETAYKSEMCESGAVVLAHLPLTAAPASDASIPFQATVDLRGTGALHLLLHGKELDATVSSAWPSPSFSGALLPTSSTVTAEGFEAHWQTVNYAAPSLWTDQKLVEDGSRASCAVVDLIDAIPTYRTIHRASKYGMLFVALAFVTYFLFEVLSRTRIHLVQYGLMGLSLSLFGLLLLSFSEPLGYTAGYVVSSSLVLVQASLYTAAVSRLSHAGIFAAMLACLFGFLYVVLGLETYALLVSSVALFIVLSVAMVLSHWVDWSTWPATRRTDAGAAATPM